MIKIFKLFSLLIKKIPLLIALGVIIFFVFMALQLTGNSMSPGVIIILLIVVFSKLGLKGRNLVFIRNFFIFSGWAVYNKLKGENKTDLIVNLSLLISGVLIIISLFMFLQPKRYAVVSVSDETICEVLGKIPAAYNNGLIDTSLEPAQVLINTKEPIIRNIKDREYYIFPMAIYEIAGVVAVKNTNSLILLGGADLGPVDIGLVWGELTKPENYRHVKVSSAFRLMMPSVGSEVNLTREYIQTHMSHNHIIPANDLILSTVNSLNKNEKVILRGYLVDVRIKHNNGLKSIWKSSLRRDDHLLNSGAGCEVFYVTDVFREV